MLPLYKTVIGLRHKRMFSFSSNAGKLMDHLIETFPKKGDSNLHFSKVGWKPNNMGAKLSNDLGNFVLEFDIDGLVLTYNYFQDDEITAKDIVSKFDNILPECLKILEATKSINRIGMINYFTFEERKNAAEELADKLLAVKLNGIPDSFTMRYALKNPTKDTLVRDDTIDYTNVIYILKSEKIQDGDKSSTLIDINIDYQVYYNPERTYKSGMIKDHYQDFSEYMTNQKVDNLLSFDTEEFPDGE